MSSSRDAPSEDQASGSKPARPGLAFRDSAGSSIVSNRTNGGDRHDVVSFDLLAIQA